MPRPRKNDIFAPLRRQAANVLAALTREIQRRESELRALVQQAEGWRAALGGVGRALTFAAPRGVRRSAGRRAATRVSARGGARIDWDKVLASVPTRFGVDDVLKHPGARAKGRAQIYPALTRWESAKKVRRIGKGKYEKTSGTGRRSAARPKARLRRRKGRASAGAKRAGAAKRSRNAGQKGRVNWDEVLKSLPAKFGASDVLKNPSAATKGQGQIYPAIGRWVATKRVKKIGKGQYQKV